MSLWATKSVSALRAEADETGEHSLQRALGPLNLVTLGIGAISRTRLIFMPATSKTTSESALGAV